MPPKFQLRDMDGSVLINEYKIPFSRFYKNSPNVLFVNSDCETSDEDYEINLCKLDFQDINDVKFEKVSGSDGTSNFKEFFTFADHLFFTAHNETFGSELFQLENDEITVTQDIFRGRRFELYS